MITAQELIKEISPFGTLPVSRFFNGFYTLLAPVKVRWDYKLKLNKYENN